ncbi:MAG: pilus assembly protein PilM, partial [Firmicutes bacterium]|nr:pilus assembly protein PilM [Bacillota bacterium]
LRAEERASSIREVLDELILLGGVSHIRGLDGMLSQELGVQAHVVNPFSKHNLAPELTLPDNYSIYGSALGLALRGLGE